MDSDSCSNYAANSKIKKHNKQPRLASIGHTSLLKCA